MESFLLDDIRLLGTGEDDDEPPPPPPPPDAEINRCYDVDVVELRVDVGESEPAPVLLLLLSSC